ncbi:hypothetical protein P5673_004773, partial [Acropora cervicornis]
IVVALLFGCSVTKPTGFKDVSLISYERMNCHLQDGSKPSVDKYVQIQCDGQSCNALCDGANSTATRLRIHKNSTNNSACIQTLEDPTYVLKVNSLTQDLIFERGQCEEQSQFIFEQKRKLFKNGFHYKYTYQPMAKRHESPMRLECSCNDIRLRLGMPNPNSNEDGSWFKFEYGN